MRNSAWPWVAGGGLNLLTWHYAGMAMARFRVVPTGEGDVMSGRAMAWGVDAWDLRPGGHATRCGARMAGGRARSPGLGLSEKSQPMLRTFAQCVPMAWHGGALCPWPGPMRLCLGMATRTLGAWVCMPMGAHWGARMRGAFPRAWGLCCRASWAGPSLSLPWAWAYLAGAFVSGPGLGERRPHMRA